MRVISRFFADEAGTSAEKYGLVAACISLAIVAVLHGVGGKLRDTWVAEDWSGQPPDR
jgi:pilus assembly protein Flp/PilA